MHLFWQVIHSHSTNSHNSGSLVFYLKLRINNQFLHSKFNWEENDKYKQAKEKINTIVYSSESNDTLTGFMNARYNPIYHQLHIFYSGDFEIYFSSERYNFYHGNLKPPPFFLRCSSFSKSAGSTQPFSK
jgi:hypothetical protein